MVPLVIEYLKTHTFAELEQEHGVEAHESPDGKVSLNYSSLIAKPGDAVAEQCRGMVVRREAGEWRVLAWPLNRFYNYGEPAAAPVNWQDNNLRVEEKLDGTMCILYHDDEKWCVATRSVPNADLPIKHDHVVIGNATFSQLFFDTLSSVLELSNATLAQWLDRLDRDVTYVFELTSPYNRVVVGYDECNVTLLAARSRKFGEEWCSFTLDRLGVPRPERWAVCSVDDIIKIVNDKLPIELEGVVVTDSADRRVKIKSLQWFFASATKEAIGATKRNALTLVLLEKVDDVVPYLDAETIAKLEEIRRSVASWSTSVDAFFTSIYELSRGNRKEFARLVKESGQWSAPLFALFDKRERTTLRWLQVQATTGPRNRSFLDTVLKVTEGHS